MKKGFIQIPILIIIFIGTAVVGSAGYITYEVVKQPEITTYTSQKEVNVKIDGQVIETEIEVKTSNPAVEDVALEENKLVVVKEVLYNNSELIPQQPIGFENEISTTTIANTTNIVSEEIYKFSSTTNEENISQDEAEIQIIVVEPQIIELPVINSSNVITTLTTANIEWYTDKPTSAKLFLSGSDLSKVYNSESGISTRHLVNISGLNSGTSYSYEFEVIADNQVTKKQGSFSTKDDEYIISTQVDDTSVSATGWNEIRIYITPLKNGEYEDLQTISMTTPDDIQNKTVTIKSDSFSFGYYPKTVGVHTLNFSWNGVSESVDLEAIEYIAVDPVFQVDDYNGRYFEPGDEKIGLGRVTLKQFDESLLHIKKVMFDTDIQQGVITLNYPFSGQVYLSGEYTILTPDKWASMSIESEGVSFNIDTPIEPGDYTVTITDMEIVGNDSGLYRYAQGLPLTFHFSVPSI